jgi:hypothetical protein
MILAGAVLAVAQLVATVKSWQPSDCSIRKRTRRGRHFGIPTMELPPSAFVGLARGTEPEPSGSSSHKGHSANSRVAFWLAHEPPAGSLARTAICRLMRHGTKISLATEAEAPGVGPPEMT